MRKGTGFTEQIRSLAAHGFHGAGEVACYGGNREGKREAWMKVVSQ